MFTGIIQTVGNVKKMEKLADSVRITVEGVPEGVSHGESVAVNGVCLTAVGDTANGVFIADVMNETLKRTNIGDLKAGDDVNLERAATLSTFLGGHLVQGHVDAVGTIASRESGKQWEVVRFTAPKEVIDHLVEKGSITVNGVSLTIVDVDGDSFTVSLIPTTLKDTNLGTLPVGSKINLEIDVFSKHIAKYLAPYLEKVGV